MKYEMIFGDEGLFDGAPDDCILVVMPPDEDKIFYLENNKSELRGSVSVMDDGVVKLAMRRIIKQPQWTWEDREAGRLPPVGIRCVWVDLSDTESPDDLLYPEVGAEIEIVANTKTYDGNYPVSVFKWLHDDGETQCYSASGHVEDFKPIETPEEKVQREQEEFVASFNSEKYSNPTLYREGLRDAYRKLKGGE